MQKTKQTLGRRWDDLEAFLGLVVFSVMVLNRWEKQHTVPTYPYLSVYLHVTCRYIDDR